MTTDAPSISISMDIDAPAHQLFRHLARPSDHAAIDGSGMLRGTDDVRVLSRVGDVFEMRMFNDQIGGYVVENHVVEFESDRRIAWEPVLKAIDNADLHLDNIGQRSRACWGWELTPLPGGGTRVTEFFDCSTSPEWLREATREGEQWRTAIETSLSRLAKLIQPGT